jgi:hypothetical protein
MSLAAPLPSLPNGSKRGTVDIDGYLDDDRIWMKLVEWAGVDTALAKKHEIYFQSANTSIMPIEEPEWKERSALWRFSAIASSICA